MSAAVAAAAAAACCSSKSRSSSRRSSGQDYNQTSRPATIIRTRPAVAVSSLGNRYEAQKRRDWNMFAQYLSNRPPLSLSRCSGAHVLDFLKHLQLHHDDHHATTATSWSWGSLDALVGRLRAAFEENGGPPETNPFAAPAVRLYLTQLKDAQAQPQKMIT